MRAQSRWVVVICSLLVVISAVVLSLFGIADGDFFWHLRNGYEILESGDIPSQDVYSYTAKGEYYAYYSWLAEVVAALLHRIGGVPLVVVAKALLSGSIFVLLGLSCRARGGRGLVIPVALLYGLLLIRFRLYARPEVFTFFLLALADLMATWYLVHGRKWVLLALPFLACAWSNLHPFVIVGMAVLIAHVVGEALGRRLHLGGAGGEGSILHLGASVLLAMIATLINPYGFRIYTPAIKLYAPGSIGDMPTREWLPPTFEAFPLFFLLAALAVAVVAVTIRKARLQDLTILAGALALSLMSLRGIGVFAVCSTAIFARHLHFVSRAIGERLRPLVPTLAGLFVPGLRGALLAGATLWATATLLSGDWSPLHQDHSQRYRFGADLARYSAPVAAVEFIEAHRLEGPILNSWSFGGYLIWRSWPRLEVAIDGRQMLFEDLLGRFQEWGPEETLRQLDVRLGLVRFDDLGLLRAFRASGDYELVFFDDLAAVFVRSDRLQGSLEPYEFLRAEEPTLAWLEGRGEDYLAAALAEAERTTLEYPDNSRAWMLVGNLALDQGDYSRAIEAQTRAAALDPTQATYYHVLGVAYLQSGRAEEASAALEQALALDPRSFATNISLGQARSQLGWTRAARAAFKSASRAEPSRPEPYLMLASLESRPARARPLVEKALTLATDADMERRAREMLEAIATSERSR